MKKISNILDYVRENLDQKIFDTSGDDVILRDEIRDQVIDITHSAIDDLDLKSDAIKGLYIYGSILSNQFNRLSDIDCRIVLDPEIVYEKYPNVNGDDLFDFVSDQIHDVNLSGTDHPLNCSIVIEGEETEIGQSELGKTPDNPVYDVLNDTVIVAPTYQDENFDPDKEFSQERKDVVKIMDNLDHLIQETRSDTIDFELIEEALGEVSNPEVLIEKLEAKLGEIDLDIDRLIAEYDKIKKERGESYKSEDGHEGIGNVLYKYLERYQYLQVLRLIKHKFEDGIEPGEVSELKEIVELDKEAQLFAPKRDFYEETFSIAPWKITQEEYVNSDSGYQSFLTSWKQYSDSDIEDPSVIERAKQLARERHKETVYDALYRGDPVSEEVLKDYPEFSSDIEEGILLSTIDFDDVRKANHVYRGMSQAEFNATVGAGLGVVSDLRCSLTGEGTCFATHPRSALTYGTDAIDAGPIYIVEVAASEEIMHKDIDDYVKTKDPTFAVPQDAITRIWEITKAENDYYIKQVAVPNKTAKKAQTEMHVEKDDLEEALEKGMITIFHRTTPEKADEIAKSQKFQSLENTGDIFFSSRVEGQSEGYGDAIIAVDIYPDHLELNDIFPSGEVHVTVAPRKQRFIRNVRRVAQSLTTFYHTTSHAGAEKIKEEGVIKPKDYDSFVSFSEIPFSGDISANDVILTVEVSPNDVMKVEYTEDWFNQYPDHARYIAGEGWIEQFTLPEECFDEEGWEDEECVEQAYSEAELDSFLDKSREQEWVAKESKDISVRIVEERVLATKKQALKIDKNNPETFATLWYENEDGEKWIPDLTKDGQDLLDDMPKGFKYQVSRFPLEVRTTWLEILDQKDIDACDHPEEYRETDHGLIDGFEGWNCTLCGGFQTKGEDEDWPEKWDGGETSREMMTGTTTFHEDIVLAMVESGDYNLEEAMILITESCERCMNVLYNEYGLEDGYEEGSEEWQKSNTICKFCEDLEE